MEKLTAPEGIGEVGINLGETMDLVHAMVHSIEDATVQEGAAAFLAGFILMASPVPLPPHVLGELMGNISMYASQTIKNYCDEVAAEVKEPVPEQLASAKLTMN